MSGAGRVDKDFEADLEFWGAPDTLRQKPRDFEVYEENAPVLEFFLRLQTQWRVSPMGQRMGLDYPGVKAAADLAGVEISPDFFHDLQTLEAATVSELLKNGNG